MTHPSNDPLFRQLARMTPAVPDATHSASVRARCHAALSRQRRRREMGAEMRVAQGQPAELVVAGGVTLIYVSLVIRDALAMYGVM